MNTLRDAAQQALEALETCDAAHISDGGQQWYDSEAVDAAITALRAALAEPQPEPAARTFAGLTVRELRIPAGMTVRIDGDTLTVAPQRDPNDPILVEPNHDPSHAPYAALAEPQPEPVAPPQRQPLTQKEAFELMDLAPRGVFYGTDMGAAQAIWLTAKDFTERAHGIGGDK